MFNKLARTQYEFPFFQGVGNNITFSTNDTGVTASLSTGISGNLHVTGLFYVSGQRILPPSSTNIYAGSNVDSFFLAGRNNQIGTSTAVSILNGTGNFASGAFNSILNGRGNHIQSSSVFTTIVGANVISASNSGNMVLADSNPAVTKTSTGNNSFLAKFGGGMTFDGDVNFIGGTGHYQSNLGVNGTLFIGGQSGCTLNQLNTQTGLLSGNLVSTGQTLYVNDFVSGGLLHSRILQASGALTGALFLTGSSLASRISVASGSLASQMNSISGALNTRLAGTGTQVVTIAGHQLVNQLKNFTDGIILGQNFVPTGCLDTGEYGMIARSGNFLYIRHDPGPTGWIRLTGGSF